MQKQVASELAALLLNNEIALNRLTAAALSRCNSLQLGLDLVEHAIPPAVHHEHSHGIGNCQADSNDVVYQVLSESLFVEKISRHVVKVVRRKDEVQYLLLLELPRVQLCVVGFVVEGQCILVHELKVLPDFVDDFLPHQYF